MESSPAIKQQSRLSQGIGVLVTILALALVVYEVISVYFQLLAPIPHLNTFLTFVLALIFLPGIQKAIDKGKKGEAFALTVLLALSLLASAYVYLFYEDLQGRIGFSTNTDIIIGVIVLVVLFEASRRAYGPVMPIIVSCFMAYAFLSAYLPPPFYQPAFTLGRFIAWMVTGLSQGVYGSLLAMAADVIFMFLLFGACLEATHATELFSQMGLLVGSKTRGGSAQTAVVSSALLGTVAGSGPALVVVTGSFSIPMMIKAGFKREVAAGIEALASTGGPLMPPVLGAIAFVMSGVTGIPYARIAWISTIPSIVFFLCIMWSVQLHAKKHNIPFTRDPVDYKYILTRLHIFIVPFGAIIYFLMMDYAPRYAAGWAIIGSLLAGFALKETRPTLRGFIESMRKGALSAAGISVTLALLGTTLAIIEITGLGMALTSKIEVWSHGYLPLALFVIMVANMLVGSLAPGFATYLILALTVGPLLLKLGVSLEAAHFFILYYAVMGLVHPPVGPAALVAAGIARASYWKTGWRAVQFGMGAMVVPFLFVYSPALLGDFTKEPLLRIIISLFSCLVGIACLQAMIERYMFVWMSWVELLLGVISIIGLMGYIFTNSMPLFLAGLAATVWVFITQTMKHRAEVRAAANT